MRKYLPIVIMTLLLGSSIAYAQVAAPSAEPMSEPVMETAAPAAEPTRVDSEPPVVTNISVSSLTNESAKLSWSTDEPATGYVEYGTTPNYGSLTPLAEDFATEHSANFSNLSADTTYYYRIVVADAAGNSSATPGESFTTEPASVPEPEPNATSTPAMTESEPTATSTPPAETPVLFSAVTAERISTSTVTIFWETDVPTDSLIQYGTTAEFGSESAHNTGLVSTHEVDLTGLIPSTAYYFRIVARPLGAANAANSELHDFATLAVPIFTDPAANISGVAHTNVTETAVHVSWLTDELTAGSLEYGTTTAYGMVVMASSSATKHSVSLASLESGTTYHYRAKATDAGGNLTYSLDRTFPTLAAIVVSEKGTIASSTESAVIPHEEPQAAAPSSGGGGAGSRQPAKPLLITAAPGDSEILFEWSNPGISGFSEVVLLRKQGGYPSSPSDGQIIYRGQAETFTDTDLPNGVTHYYALYTENGFGRFSVPLHVSLAPVAGREEIQVIQTPVSVSDTAEEHFNETIARGATGIEVTHLQQILNVAGVHESGLTTGYFGPLTEVSVQKFQDLHDLPQTGVADVATRAKLNAVSASHMITGAPESIALVHQDLSRGAHGAEVSYLQQFLVYEGSYPEALITGYFGSLTQAAVARFQSTYGVTPAIGYMGPQTRHTIQAMMGL